MGGLFYKLGRSLGYVSIPAIQKSKWVWQSLTGNEAEAVKAEGEFGGAMAAELRLKFGISREESDVALVRGIAERLSACVRNKLRSFRVEILLETTPTAMALPGGFIFVSPPLLDLCERSPDSAAFVIGHEMGHVVRGHAMERVLRQIGAEGVSSLLSRGLLNPALRETGLKWLESAYSREGEFDADEFAVRVASAAGYDAESVVPLLRRFSELRSSAAGVSHYFASHPPEADRIANIAPLLASLKAKPAAGEAKTPTG